jgi:two-component sensor histidine kinase
VVEELLSNALRHGRLPVTASVTAPRHGWLVAVSDNATDRPPAHGLDRDPAHGGMGLSLVARLCGRTSTVPGGFRSKVVARGVRTPGKSSEPCP